MPRALEKAPTERDLFMESQEFNDKFSEKRSGGCSKRSTGERGEAAERKYLDD